MTTDGALVKRASEPELAVESLDHLLDCATHFAHAFLFGGLRTLNGAFNFLNAEVAEQENLESYRSLGRECRGIPERLL